MPFASIPTACTDGLYRGRYPLGSTALVQFSEPGGSYTVPQTVTLSCATPNAAIWYTLDGSAPLVNGLPGATALRYSAAIQMPLGTIETVTAAAIAPNFYPSNQTSASYVVETTAAPPVFSVQSGTYAVAQSEALSTPQAGGIIHYTTGSTQVTTSSPIYSTPFVLNTNGTTTINALTAAGGYEPSGVVSVTITINLTPALAFNPPALLPLATEGVAYSCDLAQYVTGGVPPYAAALVAGYTLPAGLSITTSSAGNTTLISGTPSVTVTMETEKFNISDSA